MAVLFVGCGRMGKALAVPIAGLTPVYFIDPNELSIPNATKLFAPGDLPPVDDLLVVLATKPDMIALAAKSIRDIVTEDTLVISIAAGIPLARLEEVLGAHVHLARLMPNLPAAIGAGVLAAASLRPLPERQSLHLTSTFAKAGKIFWLPEHQFDAVTALSGSGPAYLIRLTELMAEAATMLGIPRKIAEAMARETLIGTGLLADFSDLDLASIRDNIASPNGTTAAALQVLDQSNNLKDLIGAAMQAALARSRGLANG